MKFTLFIPVLLIITIKSTAQITTAENGLNTPNSTTVRLGGTLVENTNIDLGTSFEFNFLKGSARYFTILNNGNIGIGTTTPSDKLDVTGNIRVTGNGTFISPVITGSLVRFGHDDVNNIFGIKTYGDVSGSNTNRYTAIGHNLPEPGVMYNSNKQGGGMYFDDRNGILPIRFMVRATGTTVSAYAAGVTSSANFLIGTATDNGNKLQVNGNLWTTGLVIPTGAAAGKVLTSDANGNATWQSGGTSSVWSLGGNSVSAASTLGTTSNYDLPIVTNNTERMRITTNGNVGIGTNAPHSKLEVGAATGDDNSHYIPTVWDSYITRFNSGNISIFSTGNATTAGDSYQLSFYGRYFNGGQGIQTNKAAYIKGSMVNDNLYPPQWAGRGILVLGSTNTNYNNNQFIDMPAMYVTNGLVGIGTSAPASQFHTTGTVRFAGLTNDNTQTRVLVSDANGNLAYRDASTISGTAGWAFGGNSVSASSTLGTISNYDLPIVTNNTERMRIGANGNVGIGTDKINETGYKLFVEGNIRTRKVRVDQDTWADYVFHPSYTLRPLQEVEKYIQEQQHLPDVPSAEEVKKQGLDLGDNQAILLKKIEELTLYVIEQNKRIDEQQKMITQQQKRIEVLEKKTVVQ